MSSILMSDAQQEATHIPKRI